MRILDVLSGNKRRKHRRDNEAFTGESSMKNTLLNWVYSRAKSKVDVNPVSAKQVSAYTACIRVIAEDIAKLPFDIYKPVGNTRTRANDEVEFILNFRFNPYMTAMQGRQTMQSNALGWGVGLAEIQKNTLGQPMALWPIHPSRLSYYKKDTGEVYWIVHNDDGSDTILKDQDVLRISGVSDDGVWGDTAAKVGAESIGLAIAEQEFGAAFYGNGANLEGLLKTPSLLDDEAEKRLRNGWNQKYQGPHNSHKVAILEQGLEFEALTVKPADAQFIESKNFSVEEICRWFRVAPHKVQHLARSTNNNIESQDVAHATDTLHPWAVRWEQEIVAKLLRKQERAKLSFRELLRGDNKTRSEYYKNMFMIGAMSPDDVRIEEAMNPREDGDGGIYYLPVNQMSVEERKAHFTTKPTVDNETEDRQTTPGSGTGASFDMVVAKMLEPFANKEHKAVTNAIEKGKNLDDFYSRNASQINTTLTGIVEDGKIVKGVNQYLGNRIGSDLTDKSLPALLAELKGYFL